MNLTEAFSKKIKNDLLAVKNKRITLRYKQRLAGLINFARPILNLPLQVVLFAYRWPHKLYKLLHLFHSLPVPFRRFLDTPPVFSDATPTQIGLVMPHIRYFSLFQSFNNILENEYFSILLAHVMFPNSIIINDNIPVISLFRRGKLPPSLLDSYFLSLFLIEVWVRPIVLYVCSADNPADVFRRYVVCE